MQPKKSRHQKAKGVGLISAPEKPLNQKAPKILFISLLDFLKKGGDLMKLVLDLKTFCVQLKVVFENTFRKKSIH